MGNPDCEVVQYRTHHRACSTTLLSVYRPNVSHAADHYTAYSDTTGNVQQNRIKKCFPGWPEEAKEAQFHFDTTLCTYSFLVWSSPGHAVAYSSREPSVLALERHQSESTLAAAFFFLCLEQSGNVAWYRRVVVC